MRAGIVAILLFSGRCMAVILFLIQKTLKMSALPEYLEKQNVSFWFPSKYSSTKNANLKWIFDVDQEEKKRNIEVTIQWFYLLAQFLFVKKDNDFSIWTVIMQLDSKYVA